MLRHITAIVSGGASGLGAATVKHIVSNGGKVIVADLEHQLDSFEVLRKDIDDGVDSLERIQFCKTDVISENQVTCALDMAVTAYGEQVNAAVNCAGVAMARKTLSMSKDTGATRLHSLDEFEKTMNINVVGTFNVARLAAERISSRDLMENGARGCFINTASIAAYDGQVGQVAYSASKGAIVGMTLPLARDLAPYGIRVVTIAPGLFKTPLLAGLPEKVQEELGSSVPCPSRLGQPAEFGMLVGSILTNPMINGETIRLDGALRMPPS